METTKNHKVGAVNFVGAILANVDNDRLNDQEFREFIRNILPIVEKPALDSLTYDSLKPSLEKFYVDEK